MLNITLTFDKENIITWHYTLYYLKLNESIIQAFYKTQLYMPG